MSIGKAEKAGLEHDNTILAYRLADWQLEILFKAISTKEINGGKVNIYETDVFTDILAIPHFAAFINFEGISIADREIFREFLRECREPLADNILNEVTLEAIHPKKKTLRLPLTYVLNYNQPDIEEGDYLFINRDIFSDKERLRLMIMQEMKNIEGKGRMANMKASEKLIRVLHIYHDLIYKGWTSKEEVDQWLERKREKPVSDRTFMRYMEIIKQLDTNVKYNAQSKRYELNIIAVLKEKS